MFAQVLAQRHDGHAVPPLEALAGAERGDQRVAPQVFPHPPHQGAGPLAVHDPELADPVQGGVVQEGLQLVDRLLDP